MDGHKDIEACWRRLLFGMLDEDECDDETGNDAADEDATVII